ncbi:MAG: hypothetical protein K0M55_19980 [Rhizobium sp.]|nr:hypothetical protein [Rhizobium sp.]MBW8318489.1 hypothetical protein [Rhizobium sp.]MBW8445207.1 hypothetical protein [Arenimonas sp.]
MTDGELKIHSDTAWNIASQWSWTLASDTRTLAAQIDVALSEARATGRREGMESMISWNAKEIERLDEQIAENNAYRIRVGNTAVSMANEYCSLRREVHEQSIAAIRAAMEKE